MTDTEKQIAGLRASLKEQKEISKKYRKALISIGYFGDCLVTQNDIFKMQMERADRTQKEVLKAKIHQNEFLIESLHKIFAEIKNNT